MIEVYSASGSEPLASGDETELRGGSSALAARSC